MYRVTVTFRGNCGRKEQYRVNVTVRGTAVEPNFTE